MPCLYQGCGIFVNKPLSSCYLVLSHLQQELSYRFVKDQTMSIAADSTTSAVTSHASKVPGTELGSSQSAFQKKVCVCMCMCTVYVSVWYALHVCIHACTYINSKNKNGFLRPQMCMCVRAYVCVCVCVCVCALVTQRLYNLIDVAYQPSYT